MKSSIQKYVPFIITSIVLPFSIYAQDLPKTKTLLQAATASLNTVIGIAILLAFLFFIIGIINFIRKANDPTGRSEGRQQIIWGIVAIFVLATIWGIVAWLRGELGLGQGSNPGILQMFGLTGGSVRDGCADGGEC